MSYVQNPPATTGLTGENFDADFLSSILTPLRTVSFPVTDPEGNALEVRDGQQHFLVPAHLVGLNLVGVRASVSTVSSSGVPTVQIRRKRAGSDVDMLSTKLTIDASEYCSSTAATPAVINTSNDDLAADDQIFIDVDVAGTGTKGLFVELVFG